MDSTDTSSVHDLADPLADGYFLDEVTPFDFYRDIFPVGELQKEGKMDGDHKYNGIALELIPGQKPKRYTITDDLDTIVKLCRSDNFVIISPISYVGKARNAKNARCLYALCVEIDNLVCEGSLQVGLRNLLHQIKNRILPKPKYIVCSGHGLHLYYKFERPIRLYPNTIERLQNYKRWLTGQLWNRFVTFSYKNSDVQYESLFQGFRMVGGVTKKNERTICFKFGENVSIDYMNSFLPKTPLSKGQRDIDEWKGLFIPTSYNYETKYKISEAEMLFPEWYQRRIRNKQKRETWTVKKDLYYWWLREIKRKGTAGHRYYCVMILVIYALKCGVSEEELRKDCNELLFPFEALTEQGSQNHFTHRDIDDAIKCFQNKDLITYPINSIVNRTGIGIEKNKRNFRNQKKHLEGARAIRDINNPNWREGNGRKPKKASILEWRNNNPNGNKYKCCKELGFDKKTIRKWWDADKDMHYAG